MVDTVVTPPVVPGSPEYDAAMVAKFDGTTTADPVLETPAVAPTRPDHIPEKFWDAEKGEVRVEAMAKSYAELEKSRGKPVEASKAPLEVATDADTTPDADTAQKAVEAAGVDFSALTTEYNDSGALSEETYKNLESKGFPKDVVDSYIAGQHALAEQWNNTGYEVAGGKDAYTKMTTWAADTLTQSEKVAFNKATQGDVDQMKLAVAGLKQKYEAENGKAPGLLGGSTSSNTSSGYQSRAEMTSDMKDPRYAKDPAFRKSVENKLANTTSF